MTSREKVLEAYPDAHEVHEDDGRWRLFTNAGPSASALSARRRYRVDAWHDAASKIGTPSSLATREQVRNLGMRLRDTANSRNDGPSDIWYWHSLAEQALMYVNEMLGWEPAAASKLPPGSPAGETASEAREMGSTLCACGHLKAWHSLKSDRYVPAASGCLAECNDGGRKCSCAVFRAVPEPVSPEGAAGPICQSRSSAGYQCIQAVTGHRKYHSTVAAPIEESNGGVFWCDDPAAPIAPAAEELIQELVRVMQSVMPALPQHRRTAIRVAVARAEEYRKGAKK